MAIGGDIEKGLRAALNGTALLFTGAGFSYGASNSNGDAVMPGRQLAKALASECNISDDLDLDLDLDVASQFFQEDHGNDELIKFLRPRYTVTSVADHHKEIAMVNWRRVYTTNYDNVYEFACSQLPREVQSVEVDVRPEKVSLSSNDCVHINGSILKLTRDTIHSSFKLTRASYLTEAFAENPWEHVFRSDVECAEAVFFIGYSLYDLDISRILFATEKLKEKAFFVVSKTPSATEQRIFSPFGSLAPIGVDGIAAFLKKTKTVFTPVTTNELPLASFDTSAPPSIKPADIRDSDIFNLLFFGDVNSTFIGESLRTGNATYTIRRTAFEDVTRAIKDGSANIVLHADLGNGKSILVEQLRSWAHDEGRKMFVFRKRSQSVKNEIQQICEREKDPIFVFENYEFCLDLIKETQLRRPQQSAMLLTSRSGVHDIFYAEAGEILGDYVEVDANRLRTSDITEFSEFLTAHGLWGDFANLSQHGKERFIARQCNAELHAILLALLESKTIHERLDEALSHIQKSDDLYRIVVSILILQILNINVDGNLLLDVLGPDVQAKLRRNGKEVSPFVDLATGDVRARSAILGQFVLSHVADVSIVLDSLIEITERAGRKATFMYSRSIYTDIVKGLVRFSNLQAMLPEKGRRQAIVRFYESVKGIRRLQDDPHFWLQYAVARITLGDLDEARQYFKTSYALCKRRQGYNTTYIDNHYARFLLLDAVSNAQVGEAMDAFKEAAIIITRQARTDNRHYPFRVGGMFGEFYEHFATQLSERDKQFIADRAQEVLSEIPKLPQRIQTQYSVRECSQKLAAMLKQLETNAGILPSSK